MSGLTSLCGYAEEADKLAVQYESFDPAEYYGSVSSLFPAAPARVLDVGAGTGRDGAWLARQGHDVTLIEPTTNLRKHGQHLHADVPLKWLDDTLPELRKLPAGKPRFDLVLCIAVLMHLDQQERKFALQRMSGLLSAGGLLFLSLRYGPVPAGRRMFEVAVDEVVAIAAADGLQPVHHDQRADKLGHEGVTWSRLGLSKA